MEYIWTLWVIRTRTTARLRGLPNLEDPAVVCPEFLGSQADSFVFSLGLHRVGSVALYGALCFSSTGLHRVLGGFRVPKGPYWSYTGDSLMALFGPCMGFEFGVMVHGLGKNQQNLEEKL